MEIAKIELAALENVVACTDTAIAELSDFELLLVGGGIGDVVLG